MKALWNNLFVPALVVALGFSAANLHAGDHNTNGSNHASSSAKSSSKTSSSSANASSAKPGMGTSKTTTDKASDGMKKDNTSTSSKGTTTPRKDTTGSTKGAGNSTGSKKDTTSTGSKPTTSTSKNESPWDSNKTGSDWGGYGGKGTTADSKGKTDSKTKPSKDNKGNTSSSKKDSPWGDKTGKNSKSTKTSDHTTTSHKMDPCPKDMPKHKTGGHYTQEQCAPKWNNCASYNKWTSCPNQWHVKFYNTYCLPTNYCFWQKKYYDARCGCYTYFDSYSSGWYYYEPVVKCYIPVSYCEQYAEERTESLEKVDACEVEVPVCETVQNYQVLPVKPACQPYTYVRHGR